MLVAIFAAAVAIYAAVMVQDIRQRQVSDLFCVGIAGLGIIRWIVLMQIAPAAWAAAAALLLFGIGLVFHWRGWLGGGDVKLIAATALLLGGDMDDIIRFLFLMSLIGSGLAILLLIQLRIIRPQAEPSAASAGPNAPTPASDHAKVPYAVAVALAATILLFLQSQRA